MASIKIIADGLSVEEAEDLLIKSLDNRHDASCSFDDPIMEQIVSNMDDAYRDQMLMLVRDIVQEMKTDVAI